MRAWAAAGLVLLLGAARPSRAEGTPESAEEAAGKAAAAFDAKDDRALGELAVRARPDPWLVADALLAKGKVAAATAFAAAAPGPDTELLAGYAKSRAGVRDASLRKALFEAAQARKKGKPEDTIRLAEAARAGDDSVPGIRLLEFRAFAFEDIGRRKEAADAFEAVGRAAAALGWRSLGAADLDRAAILARGRCDYLRAMAIRERLLALQRLRRDPVSVAGAQANLGLLLEETGEFAKAMVQDEAALDGFRAADDKAGMATVLSNLGILYASVGEVERGLASLEKALALEEEIQDRRGKALTQSTLAMLFAMRGEYPRAFALAEEARKVQFEIQDWEGAISTLGAIGLAYEQAEMYREEKEQMQRAVSAAGALGDRVVQAWTTMGLANAHAGLGEYAEAEAAYRSAGEIAGEVALREARALALAGRAGSLRRLGRIPEAIASAHEGALAMAPVLAGFADTQGFLARSGYRGIVYSVGFSAAIQAADPQEAAFFLEGGRAGMLLEALRARETLHASSLPKELLDAEYEARAREAAAAQAYRDALSAGNAGETAARRKDLDAARDQSQAVLDRIQLESKTAASLLYPVPDPLDRIRARLAPGEALLLYGILGPLPANTGSAAFVSRQFPHDAAALVVTSEGARIVPLGTTAAIEETSAAFRPEAGAEEVAAAAAALADRVVKPLHLGPEVRRLLISTEGGLSYVPFALLDPSREVVQVPSGTILGVLLAEAGKRGEGILALGNPDPGVRAAPGLVAMVRGPAFLQPLPGTEGEAKAVGTKVLLGKDATEERLRTELATRTRWRAVHIACHGILDQERPMFSSLALSPAGEDDGFLTVLDVFRMKVPADLVVLSACETGRGKVVRGEGILGLARAFMYAGAPRVIVSLWKVDDEATRALMERFYALWNPRDGKAGLGAAAALQQAQAWVASQPKWKHPRYWAAWVLWGLPE